ncbi:MAG: hypothetical protein K6L74_00640 [Neptuniibacter sp.]
MKKLLVSALTLAMLSAPASVFAHQGNGEVSAKEMGKRSHMMQMHEHMGKTEQLMEKIKKNPEPEKRQMLMHEHMKEMRMGMDMMNDSGHMMGQGKKSDTKPCPHMDSRMDMMDERMGMMQKMMQQMMEHQSQRDMPMHR